MTDREREFAALGFEYAEGIDLAKVVVVPTTGREIRKTESGKWECQPWNDNYWQVFDDLLDALRFATCPKDIARGFKVGDRVQVKTGILTTSSNRPYAGKVGVVIQAEDGDRYNITVVVETDNAGMPKATICYHDSELEPLGEKP